MAKSTAPATIGEFVVLPVTFQSKALGKDVQHYIYVKAYEPKIPDEESPRSLLLVNIPVTANEAQLRHLLTTQLDGGHVQNVHFAAPPVSGSTNSSSTLIATTPTRPTREVDSNLGKRKRQGESSEEIVAKLATKILPDTVPSQLHVTGSTAIAVFLDRASRDLTLRACKKLVKGMTAGKSKAPIWSVGLELSKQPLLGLKRYEAQRVLTYPPRADLLRLVDDYMSTYAELEEAESRESAKKRAEPDEDGFITVTRGTKGVVKADEAESMKQKLQEKWKNEQGLEDFYRFQHRERRKEEAGKLMRQFEGEQQRVREMRERRGKSRPER